jgi:multiple sugar transport system substrate-binding protein
VFFNPNPNILRPIEVSAILTLGGDWMYAPDGKKSGINVPDVKNVIQTIHDMMNIDKSAPTYGDMMSQKQTMEGVFLAGKAAITYGAWSIRSVKDVQNYPHDFVTAFAPYPIPDNQKEIYAYGGHSDFLSVNSKTKNADASWEFIKWYSTKGMMPLVVGGRIPVYSGYNINEVAAAIISGAEKLLDPVTTAEVLELKDQYAIPEITFKGSEITQVYIEEAEAVLTGRKQIDAGLSDAQTRADRILGQ